MKFDNNKVYLVVIHIVVTRGVCKLLSGFPYLINFDIISRPDVVLIFVKKTQKAFLT